MRLREARAGRSRATEERLATFDALCSLRLLVADDDTAVRELLRERLEADGARLIGEAADGIEAVALALGLNPDLVLLDCAMPRLDGFGAARLIRAARPATRVVLQSGEADGPFATLANGLGLRLLDKRAVLLDPADALERALLCTERLGRAC